MIKIIMNNGVEYELSCDNIEAFKKEYLCGNNDLNNKLINISDYVSINLNSISSIEKEKYISGIDTIIP